MNAFFDSRWDQLPHLFAGELPHEQARALEQWIDAAPERREAMERMYELWRLAGTETISAGAWNAETGLAAIRRRTAEHAGLAVVPAAASPNGVSDTAARRPPLRWSWLTMAATAAAIVVAAGAATLISQVRRSHSAAAHTPAAFTEFTTPRGQRLALRLHDGTLVTLAPASTLRLSTMYGRQDRAVFLDGEAAFLVTHDGARPFSVRAGRLVARDLGTKFVVRAYDADSTADVVVAEGAVMVEGLSVASGAGGRSERAVLTHGEHARLTSDGDLRIARGVSLAPYFSWTAGRLVFTDTPLEEVARQLGRWHDVEIRLADMPTARRRLTASFGDEPIAEVVHRIAVSLDLEVRRTDRLFTLRVR